MSLSVEQRLQRAFVQISNSPEYCLVSGVMLCGASTVSDTVPTACTDGWNVQYGRKFMSGLNEKEFNGVVLHETYHKALRQLTIWAALNEENPRLANMAADYVINLMIEDADPSHLVACLPKGALLDETFRGMNTKEVFEFLKENGKGGKGGKGEPEEGDGSAVDTHEWADPKTGDADSAVHAQRDQAIDGALRQGRELQKRIGKGRGGGNRALEDLLAPKVNWREQLRDFVTSITAGKDETSWQRLSRRGMSRGVHLPYTYSESVGEIVVAIDTSGSISDRELRLVVSELVGICEQVTPDKVHLIWWGSGVVGEQLFVPGQYDGMASALRPANGGGTDLSCVPAWITEHRVTPTCLIVLTDGYFDAIPAPGYPCLFVLTHDKTVTWANGGAPVNIRVRD